MIFGCELRAMDAPCLLLFGRLILVSYIITNICSQVKKMFKMAIEVLSSDTTI
jgi:hypothetical protein